MKFFVAVVLALQVCAGVAKYKCGTCYCYEKNEKEWGSFWSAWNNKTVAHCYQALNVFPFDLPADIEVLGIREAAPQLTSLEANILISYEKLTDFRLTRSHLQLVHEQTFLNSTSTLTYISFSNNSLTDIPTNLFCYAPNVVTIGLGSNKLRALQTNLFSNLEFLKTIELDNNEITLIEDNCFYNLPSLEEVHLFNNKIQTINFNIMPQVNTLRILTLDGNPWDCKTELCPFMHVVNNRQLWGTRAVPFCATPENIQGKKWNEIQYQDMPLSFKPNSLRAYENYNFTLECKYCFPTQLRWSVNGEELPLNYQEISKESAISKLVILDAHKEQQGKYKCYITNCPECGHVGLFVGVQKKPLQICRRLPCP